MLFFFPGFKLIGAVYPFAETGVYRYRYFRGSDYRRRQISGMFNRRLVTFRLDGELGLASSPVRKSALPIPSLSSCHEAKFINFVFMFGVEVVIFSHRLLEQ